MFPRSVCREQFHLYVRVPVRLVCRLPNTFAVPTVASLLFGVCPRLSGPVNCTFGAFEFNVDSRLFV